MRQIILVIVIFVLMTSAVAGNAREKRWWWIWWWSCPRVQHELASGDYDVAYVLSRATRFCLKKYIKKKQAQITNLKCTIEELETTLNTTQTAVSELQEDLAECEANLGNTDACKCQNIDAVLSGLNSLTVNPMSATSGIVTVTCATGLQFFPTCTEVADSDFQWTLASLGLLTSSDVRDRIETDCAVCTNINTVLTGIDGLTIDPDQATSGSVTITCSNSFAIDVTCYGNGEWTNEGVLILNKENLIARVQDECGRPFR
ncbi:hypothetical protein FSP39_007102 [Pinctada imbricata]|uniref:Uncharacterized protein n=1 Tax=Pinctada imbricata TaxID=66713 RepID=A0AA88XI46_PINIB|nr:hypothetical protein FSP39_007102 [Pinctada imbricata]